MKKYKHMPEVGRPTKMTEETVRKLEEGFSMGFTDEESCLYADISKPTLYEYIKEHPEFSARKETLKNHPKLLAKRNILKSLKDNKDVKDSQWYAETKMKKEFSKRTELTGEDGERLIVLPNELIDKNGINTGTKDDSKGHT